MSENDLTREFMFHGATEDHFSRLWPEEVSAAPGRLNDEQLELLRHMACMIATAYQCGANDSNLSSRAAAFRTLRQEEATHIQIRTLRFQLQQTTPYKFSDLDGASFKQTKMMPFDMAFNVYRAAKGFVDFFKSDSTRMDRARRQAMAASKRSYFERLTTYSDAKTQDLISKLSEADKIELGAHCFSMSQTLALFALEMHSVRPERRLDSILESLSNKIAGVLVQERFGISNNFISQTQDEAH